MKATGIVRRIDDLGRVVIPKEIRRTMRIREGEDVYKRQSLRSTVSTFWPSRWGVTIQVSRRPVRFSATGPPPLFGICKV